MNSALQSTAMMTGKKMLWCCIYTVERAGKSFFVYGYGVSAQEAANQWASNSVFESTSWRLNKTCCFFSESDLADLKEKLLTGSVQLPTKSGILEISVGSLHQRPTVYAVPRTLISLGSPQSFSDDPATVDSLWCLSKKALIETLFPQQDFDSDQVRDAIGILFRQLSDETSISFLVEEAGRFGNFEVVNYLSGDVRRSDGLCSMISSPGRSIAVWIEPPLALLGNLTINVRMFNGGTKNRTCILDELLPWEPNTPIQFSPAEPYTDYEISVWCNGRVIAYNHQSVLRQINGNLTFSGEARRHVTRWSQGFTGALRQRAESVRFDTSTQITTRSPLADPWRDSEKEAKDLVETWFPTGSKGRFFVNKQASTIEAIEFLVELIRRPDVTRVTIIDPFFDRIGVESLLTRLRDVNDVCVLASHVPGSEAGSVDQTVELASVCDTCRQVLPKKLEIINIESPGGQTQQFHDRYIDLEMESEGRFSSREVWMLSNSISSLAVRYPLVVVPLSADVVNQMTPYLDALKNGHVPGRPDVQSRKLWTNVTSQSPGSPVPIARLTRMFPGSELILKLLVPDVLPDTEQPKVAVARKLLTEYSPDIDWHVPEEAVSKVVEVVKQELSTNISNRNALLSALSQWAYHGGPAVSKYNFSEGEIAFIGEALAAHLRDRAQTHQITVEFPPLLDGAPMPECLEHIWYLRNYSPFRNGRPTPELDFLAEALWEVSPATLFQILCESRNYALFILVCFYGSGSDESRALLLLNTSIGAVQALGVLFLHDNATETGARGGSLLDILCSKLENSSLPPLDRLLAMIFICARYAKSEVPYTTPFAACASLWGNQYLDDSARTRIITLIDRVAPYRAVPLAVALAAECPIPVDAASFRQWCIGQIQALLPLRPQHPQQPGIRVLADPLTFAKAAEAAWQLHQNDTPIWFLDSILRKVDPWSALAPLQRAREYTKWNDALDGVLRVLAFGISLCESAPNLTQRLEIQKKITAPMAKLLLNQRSEIWHHFGDFDGLLTKIVAFLGQSASPESSQEAEKIVLDETIPNVWRLLLVLNSSYLVKRFESHVVSMAAAPTTPSSDHDRISIEKWAEDITSAAEKLGRTEMDLRELLSDVANNINQWKNSLTGIFKTDDVG